MTRKLLTNLLFFMALPVATFAAQIKEALPDGEVEALIAADELSRIKVMGDRIKSVRSHESEVEIVEDRDLGEIYLRPNTHKPVNMFVTTERNNTYKLLLVPKRVPSEQIFIRGLDEMLADTKTQQAAAKTGSDGFKDRIIALMRSMVLGNGCAGFKRIETGGNADIEVGNIRLKEEASYVGSKVKGQVFEIIDGSEIDDRFAKEQKGIIAMSVSSYGSDQEVGKASKLYLISLIDEDE